MEKRVAVVCLFFTVASTALVYLPAPPTTGAISRPARECTWKQKLFTEFWADTSAEESVEYLAEALCRRGNPPQQLVVSHQQLDETVVRFRVDFSYEERQQKIFWFRLPPRQELPEVVDDLAGKITWWVREQR